MSRKRGGQVAIEFIFLVVVAFVVSIIFTYGIIDRTIELNDEKEFVAVQDISYKMQNEIAVAGEAEPGYFRDFEMPLLTHMFDYNLTINDTTLITTTQNKEYILIVPQVQGSPNKGWNKICKQNGTIMIQTGDCIYS